MARRTVISIDHDLKVGIQPIFCGAGLLGGLILGAAITYLSALWPEFADVLKTLLDSMTKSDLIVVTVTVVIVFGCGWLGARWGIERAARIEI